MSSSFKIKEEEEEVEEEEEEEEPMEEEEEEEEITEEEDKEEVKKIPKNPMPMTSSSSPLPVLDTIQHLRTLNSALTDFFHNYTSLDQTLTSLTSFELPPDPPPKHANPKKQEKREKANKHTLALTPICKSMNSASLRTYLNTHINDRGPLFKAVPAALKLAPNPTRLVLDVVNKYHLAPRKAFTDLRSVSTFLLELFLFAFQRAEPDQDMRWEAEGVAVAWKGRMVKEGGVDQAGRDDSLGLAFFVACFGVPEEFGIEDLCFLFGGSNLKRRDALCHSSSLREKTPGIKPLFFSSPNAFRVLNA